MADAAVPPTASRIIVRAVNWLGDLVISLPALRAVRRTWPNAHLAVMVADRLAGFYSGAAGSLVDEVIPFTFRAGLPGLADRWRFARRVLAPGRFDLGILFPNSFDSALVFLLAGVPRRVGYRRDGRGLLLTRSIPVTAGLLDQHQVHYYLNLARTLGADGSPDCLDLPILPQARARADELLSAAGPRRAALAPGAAFGPAKAWPVDKFAALADRLAADGWTPVFVGAPGQDALAAAGIVDRMNRKEAAVNLAGRTDVAELLGVLSRCAAFIGNDSGAMHAAAAMGLPAVGLFGSTDPDRTGPLGPHARAITKRVACAPCFLRVCPLPPSNNMTCLRAIDIDEVLAVLKELTEPPCPSA
jgi:heptosyltransferase II